MPVLQPVPPGCRSVAEINATCFTPPEPYLEHGPLAVIHWSFYGEAESARTRILAHYCATECVDGIVAYVRETYHHEPVEIAYHNELHLDPGGSALYAARKFRLEYNRFPVEGLLSHVEMLLHVFATRHRPGNHLKTYGGLPCLRWRNQFRLNSLPLADVEAIEPLLAAYAAEGHAVLAAAHEAVAGHPHVLVLNPAKPIPSS